MEMYGNGATTGMASTPKAKRSILRESLMARIASSGVEDFISKPTIADRPSDTAVFLATVSMI
jgi:hypothetical protein